MRVTAGRLAVVFALGLMSAAAAFGLFYFLDSAAEIEQRGVKLGGAVAGFVVVFYLLQRTYFQQWSGERQDKDASADEKIKALQDQIDALVAGKLDNFNVPQGYEAEISTAFNFGFAYPAEWELTHFPAMTQYCAILDPEVRSEVFRRNMNVVITDISEYIGDLDALYDARESASISVLTNARVVWREATLFMGLKALKVRIDWNPQQLDLAAYQIIVADRQRANLYEVTFTTLADDFDASRVTFDSIASTFRI